MFNAAKTGNLDELKKLKGTGADLSQKDKDGNTPLLWAACYGHLDVVQWLLKKDGGESNITEKNETGETALSLAIAYGQLDVVQWLLREHTELLNKASNTPLSQAINCNQLAIVDCIIRNYYLESVFNLDFISKNKAIHFYLELVTLSCQDNNESGIHSLIGMASTQLKKSELVFLQFFCLWIDIRWQRNQSTYSVGEITKDLYIEQLLPCQQIELISYMFEVGYVLNYQPVKKGLPALKGRLINKEHKIKIQTTLEKIKDDEHYKSINSDSKKLELYNTYYLVPLYRSLTYALQTDARINKALDAPYTYHSSFKDKPLLEADVAKWTAYHLCQDVNVLEQQHLEVYARTAGLSRLGYYETVETYLGDTHPQKTTLLIKLGNQADFKGERLHWVKNYPSWLQNLGQALSTQDPLAKTPTLKLINLSQTIPLNHTVCQAIWDSTKNKPMPSTLPGNHPVYELKTQGIYFKLYPGLPGINDALQCLYRRLFCAFSGLPWSVSGLLNIDNQTIPVLLSKDGGRQIEANDKGLDKLDPYTRSKLILFTILTNTEDGKRENHALLENDSGFCDIYSIDNDQGLVNATTETDYWLFKSQKLSVKSILFCLNAMNEPLDKRAIDELLLLKPENTLNAWLDDLIQLEESYETLFKECRDRLGNEDDPYRRSYLKMVLPVSTLLRIAYKFERLQTILNEDGKTTPLRLLRLVEPDIARYYEPILKEPLSSTERFDKLVKEEKLYNYCKKTQSYSTTITSSREIFESLVPDNLSEVVTPRLALEIFKSISQNLAILKQDHVRLMLGEIARLNQLPLTEQEVLLKLTRLNQFNLQSRIVLLKSIAARTDFEELYLNYPEAALSNSLFEDLLANNSKLFSLSITSATKLTSLIPINGLTSLKTLRLTQLVGVTQFTATLPKLTELTIRDNSQLTTVKVNAPMLNRLRLVNCENLVFLDLPQSLILDNVTIESCGKLLLSDFYQQWPGFISRCSDVPQIFQQRLADSITQSNIDTIPALMEPVYKLVTVYLDRLRPLCQKLDESPAIAFTSTLALAYLGFSTPRVIEILLIGLAHFDSLNLGATSEAICALQHKNELIIQRAEKMLQYNFISAQYIAAIKVLSRFQVKNELIINKLRELLEYKDESVRLSSANALIILEELTPTVANSLLRLVRYGAKDVTCKKAIDLLFSMNIAPETVIVSSLEGLTSDNLFNRLYAIKATTSLRIKDGRIAQALIHILNHDLSPNRKAAAKALGLLQMNNDFIHDALTQALKDENRDVSEAAKKALNSIQKNKVAIQIIPIDKEWTIQEILRSLTKSDPLKRRDAVNAAGMLKAQDEQVMRALLNALGDRNFEVRQGAMKALVACIQQPEDFLKPELAELITLFKEQESKAPNNPVESSVSPNQQSSGNSKSISIIPKTTPNPSPALFPYSKENKPTKSIKNGLSSSAAGKGDFKEAVKKYLGEKKAFAPFLDNKVVSQYYLEIFSLFSQSLINYTDTADSLSKETQLNVTEISSVHLFYLCMQVSHHANKAAGKIESISLEPTMHQLQPAHQTELISHMIKEGYVLNNWFINANEVLITDMLFDEKQVLALEKLLEKSTYDICLKSKKTVTENKKIYLEINEEGQLEYSVLDFNGKIQSGAINMPGLKAPLTLSQIKSVPELLTKISDKGHICPEIQTLNLKKVRFTKEYQLLRMSKGILLEKNRLYVEIEKGSLTYTVLNSFGKKVTGTISSKQIEQWGDYKLPSNSINLIESLKPKLAHILKITSERGHTVAEDATKGYKTFLSLLKDQFLLPNLQALHLQDCDLYDDFDLTALCPTLAQGATLKQLNLDYNHITRIGLLNLLSALFEEEKSKSTLENLSVCFNKIEISSKSTFNFLTLKATLLNELHLKGNMIADDVQAIKRTHKYRVVALFMLFQALSKQEANLTINSFLRSTDVNLTRGEGGHYLLSLTLANLQQIEMRLNHKEFECFESLGYLEEKLGERKAIFPTPTSTELFNSLISGITPERISEQLNNSILSPSSSNSFEKKQICKQLLSYHSNDKIKGLLVTHSFFKSPRMEKQPSFLFPEAEMTLQKGWVYLIANKYKGLDGEHSMLAYEYLTSYGQRVFKVAHLVYIQETKEINIEFKTLPLFILIPWIIKDRLIAKYQADTKRLRCMHKDIQNDTANVDFSGTTYQKLIFGSSRKKDIMNCLTYCLNKMHDHLNINIPMEGDDCFPSTVVRRCIDVNIVIETNQFDLNLVGLNEGNFKK